MKKRTLILGAGAAAAAAYCLWEENALTVERYAFEKGLPEPIRIVSLADLHGKSFGMRNRRLLKTVAALDPDLIVMPGDTVSSDCRNLFETAQTIGALCAVAPVYLVPGNHEQRSGRMHELLSLYLEAGAQVLCDELRDTVIKGTPVHILGLAEKIGLRRADYLRAMLHTCQYPDNDAALLELAQKDGLRIVLTHFPELFGCIGARSYRRFDFDLLFAGHAHGGQIRLPGVGGLFAPGQGFLPRYTAGQYGDRPRMILSRGLGNDGLVPRIHNRPEIACVTVL